MFSIIYTFYTGQWWLAIQDFWHMPHKLNFPKNFFPSTMRIYYLKYVNEENSGEKKINLQMSGRSQVLK